MEECRLDSSGSGQGQVAGSCENGNEPYKVEGISWLAGGLLASQGHCSKESESVHLTYLWHQRHKTRKLWWKAT